MPKDSTASKKIVHKSVWFDYDHSVLLTKYEDGSASSNRLTAEEAIEWQARLRDF